MIIVLFLYHVQRYDSYFLKISTGKCKQYIFSYTPYTPSDIPQTSDHSCITRYFCGFIHQTILLWSSDYTTWQVHTAWFRSSQEPSISYAFFTCITTFLNHALHSSEASQKKQLQRLYSSVNSILQFITIICPCQTFQKYHECSVKVSLRNWPWIIPQTAEQFFRIYPSSG